jgi:dephospho-CoA kinase
MIKVGITGGIGSGKSTVCQIFESLNVPIYYADERAKKLMTSNKNVKKEILASFGKEAYFNNGRLNRKYIAAKVFNNKPLLKKLNAIVHPAVKQDGIDWFNLQKGKFAIKEAALLIEAGSHKDLDKIIVVTCPLETRIDRVVYRDKISRQTVMHRIKNQLSEEEKIRFADFIIVNDGKKALIPQVVKVYKKLTSGK